MPSTVKKAEKNMISYKLWLSGQQTSVNQSSQKPESLRSNLFALNSLAEIIKKIYNDFI